MHIFEKSLMENLRGGIRRTTQSLERVINREAQQCAYNLQVLRGVGRPVVFQVELTNRCPMTCQMCPRTHSMQRPLGIMTRETYLRVLEEARHSTSHVFLHHFGDSLTHPELGEFIGEASRRGIKSYLSGNPILLTTDRIRAIVDQGLTEIVLSLDGLTPQTLEAIRGPAARNLALAERRIRELVAYRAAGGATNPRIIIQMVASRTNEHEVDDWLRRWCDEPGIDRVKVKSFVSWSGDEEGINALRIGTKPGPSNVVCEKPWTSITVLWDGRVVPCCFDHDARVTLGDVATSSLHDIWRGPALRDLRRRHRAGELDDIALCRSCVDKEGYRVRSWWYPLNRLRHPVMPLGAEIAVDRVGEG